MQNTKILYSAEQIEIPKKFGDILLQYSKEVIRNRVKSENLLEWSSKLCNKEEPFKVEGEKYIPGKLENVEFNSDDLRPVPTSTLEVDNKPSEINFSKLAYNYTSSLPQLRPLVLCGPPGIGKSTIIQKLMLEKPDIFKNPVYHTTRKKREDEVTGEDYYFISGPEYEKKANNGEFIVTEKVGTDKYALAYKEIFTENSKPVVFENVDEVDKQCLHVHVKSRSLEEYRKLLELSGTRSANEVRELVEGYDIDKFCQFVVMNDSKDIVSEIIQIYKDQCGLE